MSSSDIFPYIRHTRDGGHVYNVKVGGGNPPLRVYFSVTETTEFSLYCNLEKHQHKRKHLLARIIHQAGSGIVNQQRLSSWNSTNWERVSNQWLGDACPISDPTAYNWRRPAGPDRSTSTSKWRTSGPDRITSTSKWRTSGPRRDTTPFNWREARYRGEYASSYFRRQSPETPLSAARNDDGEFLLGSRRTIKEDDFTFIRQQTTKTFNTIVCKTADVKESQKALKTTKPQSSTPEKFPRHLKKYYRFRHRLFFGFDYGIKLSGAAWFSVTPEALATHHATRALQAAIEGSPSVAIDGFCGSGGNAIQLAKKFNFTLGLDVDQEQISNAQNNAKVYGVDDNVIFRCSDYFRIDENLKADVVFLSPPWGGPNYDTSSFDVMTMGGSGFDTRAMMAVAHQYAKNIILYVPKSSDISQIVELAIPYGAVDIEMNFLNGYPSSVTAYFGSRLCADY